MLPSISCTICHPELAKDPRLRRSQQEAAPSSPALREASLRAEPMGSSLRMTPPLIGSIWKLGPAVDALSESTEMEPTPDFDVRRAQQSSCYTRCCLSMNLYSAATET